MKNIVLLLILCFGFVFSGFKEIKDIDKQVRKIRIGMKKERVISIMGDDYKIVGAKEDVLVLKYPCKDSGFYKFLFVDKKLIEFEIEQPNFCFPHRIKKEKKSNYKFALKS